jgi:hypothetical protein
MTNVGSYTMGRVFTILSGLGVLVLAALVILAILSLAGVFDPTYTNPPS